MEATKHEGDVQRRKLVRSREGSSAGHDVLRKADGSTPKPGRREQLLLGRSSNSNVDSRSTLKRVDGSRPSRGVPSGSTGPTLRSQSRSTSPRHSGSAGLTKEMGSSSWFAFGNGHSARQTCQLAVFPPAHARHTKVGTIAENTTATAGQLLKARASPIASSDRPR
jgi:hypothetical protein